MKILMIAPQPIFEPRGTPLSVVGRLKALSDMGHEVDLLTYSIGEDVHLPGVRFLRIPKVPGIRKVKIGPSMKKIPLDFFLMVKTFFQLCKKKYNWMHTHEEAGFWGSPLSRLFRIPHIYDMHSSLPQQLSNFQFTKSKFLIGLFELLEKNVLKYASSVITICPDLYDYVQSHYPERGSILIENVIDYGMIFDEEDKSSSIKKELMLDDRIVALYTGTFEPYQGLDMLIASSVDVIKADPSVVFLMVGGHPEQVEFYRQMAVDQGVASRFIFTGQVQPNQVNSYIRCADLLLSPRTKGTNTPLKIYAYLRSGLPVVATRLLTHTQVMDESVSILTEANPTDYAEGILSIIKNKKKAKSIGRAAAKLADKEYSYPVYLEKFKRVISLALERGV